MDGYSKEESRKVRKVPVERWGVATYTKPHPNVHLAPGLPIFHHWPLRRKHGTGGQKSILSQSLQLSLSALFQAGTTTQFAGPEQNENASLLVRIWRQQEQSINQAQSPWNWETLYWIQSRSRGPTASPPCRAQGGPYQWWGEWQSARRVPETEPPPFHTNMIHPRTLLSLSNNCTKIASNCEE